MSSDKIQQQKLTAEQYYAQNNWLSAIQTIAHINLAQTNDNNIKNQLTQLVCNILLQLKDSDISQYIQQDQLNQSERVMLLKYIYRAMYISNDSTAITNVPYTNLLKWQSAIVDRDGQGAIAKVLNDKQFNDKGSANASTKTA